MQVVAQSTCNLQLVGLSFIRFRFCCECLSSLLPTISPVGCKRTVSSWCVSNGRYSHMAASHQMSINHDLHTLLNMLFILVQTSLFSFIRQCVHSLPRGLNVIVSFFTPAPSVLQSQGSKWNVNFLLTATVHYCITWSVVYTGTQTLLPMSNLVYAHIHRVYLVIRLWYAVNTLRQPQYYAYATYTFF